MIKWFTSFLLFLLVYQAVGQSVSNDYENTLKTIDSLIVSDNRDTARSLLKKLHSLPLSDYQQYELFLRQKRISKHQIGVNHQLISFQGDYTTQRSWNITSFEYQRSISKHTLISRVSYTDRFNESGYLYEIEAYPVINTKLYGFITLSAANNGFNQNFGNGASLFYGIGKGYETEVGYRYFQFDSNSFVTYAGGLTKYTGNFYLNARVTLGPENEAGVFQNYQLTTRYYFENAANYAFIRLGTGISPDDVNRFNQVASNPSLEALYASAGFLKWHKSLGVGATAGVLVEDIPLYKTGTQWLGAIELKYRIF